MFNDDESYTFKKMHEFSTVDGFVEVGESMADMIKYVANEPSVGLYYVQQHIRNAVPNLVDLKNKVADKSHEMVLHTEDAEDSISMIRSVREHGHAIADDMIKDIECSLALVSAKQQKRGFISSPSSAFRIGIASSWGSVGWGRSTSSSERDGERSGTYLSNVIKSARERASSFKWPQTESHDSRQAKGDPSSSMSHEDEALLATASKESSSMPEAEADELPLSSPLADGQEELLQLDKNVSHDELLSLAENYSEFKADKEAKLELWLAETRNSGSH